MHVFEYRQSCVFISFFWRLLSTDVLLVFALWNALVCISSSGTDNTNSGLVWGGIRSRLFGLGVCNGCEQNASLVLQCRSSPDETFVKYVGSISLLPNPASWYPGEIAISWRC